MKRIKTVKELNENAMGHNSKARDEQMQKYVQFVAKKLREKKIIDDQIKEEMVSAKEDGCDIDAIKWTAKYLNKDTEGRAILDSKQVERERTTKLCEDLPLFNKAA